MPVCGLLVVMSDGEQQIFSKWRRHEVQSHGKSAGDTGRCGQCRKTGEVDSAGVGVAQIHGDGVVDFLSNGECGERRGRTHDEVDVFEGSGEICANESAQLLCLQVIRIVVAGGEHVCSDHDSAFDFGSESFTAASFVEVLQIHWR